MKNELKNQLKDLLKDLPAMTVGIAIVAVAVHFFLEPSHAAVSSIAGLAIVLANFIPLTVSQLMMILNVALLIVGFLFCGSEFGAKTVYTSVMLPLMLGVLEIFFPHFQSMTNDATLDVACYIFVVSIGLMILFNRNASSGGLDIVAKVMNKYLHMSLGTAMSVSGMCIALSSALAYDKKTVVLSVLGTYLNGIVLDYFIFGQSMKKRVCILSSKEAQVQDFIIHTLHSGATLYEVTGAYDGHKQCEIETIVDKNEYQKLYNYILQEDPGAFVTVYTVNDIRYKPKK